MLALRLVIADTAPGWDVNNVAAREMSRHQVQYRKSGLPVESGLYRQTSGDCDDGYQGTRCRESPFTMKARKEGRRTTDVHHKIEAPEMAEIQVKLADYRNVNGVQLPHKWTTIEGEQTVEVFDVASYDINPANIAEKFQNQKVFLRSKKEAN